MNTNLFTRTIKWKPTSLLLDVVAEIKAGSYVSEQAKKRGIPVYLLRSALKRIGFRTKLDGRYFGNGGPGPKHDARGLAAALNKGRGTLSSLGLEFGISRERVRQIAEENHITSYRRPRHTKP